MKKKKDKLFFVKEMPANEEQDVSRLKRLSHTEVDRLLKDSKKSKRKRAA
jgi:hypothetical protein